MIIFGLVKSIFKMIRIIKNIFFGIIALVAAMVVLSFFLPEKYTSEQTQHINAPVDYVFEQVNDLKNWETWSYFANLDPNWETEFGNWSSGKNGAMRWTSDSLGNGNLEIIESIPNKSIQLHFDYDENNKSGYANFYFQKVNDGTKVIYELEFPVELTPQDKFANIFTDKSDKNKFQFDYSLSRLKGVSEKNFKQYLKQDQSATN